MRIPITLTLLFAGLVSAADFTGRWVGTLTFDDDPQGKPVGLELRQVQGRIIGVVLGKQAAMLTDGKGSEKGATFRVQAEGEEIGFDVTIAGDHLTGKVSMGKAGENQSGAKLDAYRASNGSGPFSGIWTATIGTSETVTLHIYPRGTRASGVLLSARGEEVF